MRPIFTFSLVLVLATPITGMAQPVVGDPSIQLLRAFPNLVLDDNVTASTIIPGTVRRCQRGQVRLLPDDRKSSEAPMFLDLKKKMREETGFEDGLHGVAFHSRFPAERRVYLCYSQSSPRRTVLSEFSVPEGPVFLADPASERVLLEYAHPLGNHWGGGISFGPDGLFYIGIGDGGVRDDPYRLGQNLWSLHGKNSQDRCGRPQPGTGLPDSRRQSICEQTGGVG